MLRQHFLSSRHRNRDATPRHLVEMCVGWDRFGVPTAMRLIDSDPLRNERSTPSESTKRRLFRPDFGLRRLKCLVSGSNPPETGERPPFPLFPPDLGKKGDSGVLTPETVILGVLAPKSMNFRRIRPNSGKSARKVPFSPPFLPEKWSKNHSDFGAGNLRIPSCMPAPQGSGSYFFRAVLLTKTPQKVCRQARQQEIMVSPLKSEEFTRIRPFFGSKTVQSRVGTREPPF